MYSGSINNKGTKNKKSPQPLEKGFGVQPTHEKPSSGPSDNKGNNDSKK